MGQVPDDLNEIVAVEAEVDALRDRTQKIVAELERRLRVRASQVKETFENVKKLTDVPAQIVAHPRVIISVTSGVVLVLALGTYYAIARRRAARRPMARLRGRLGQYRALLADPGAALRPPPRESIARRLLKALLVAGATTLVRGLGQLLLTRANEPPPSRALPPGLPRALPPHR